MPKKYYCDFCDCTFPDNQTNRNNHQKGRTHVQHRKLHYDWFADPVAFLAQYAQRPPCRTFLEHAHCEFGLLCKYSHLLQDPLTGLPIYPNEILYFQSLLTAPPVQARFRLPSRWKHARLPPSLVPPNLTRWEHEAQWG
ncbi:hypothetical protein BY458DRAFT_501302 [Sporodiniella umbellata]|nr:hypothetical protein BY458DRAFT_501302 [Sporodiniella umbellata]